MKIDFDFFETRCNPVIIPLHTRDITFWGCGLGGESGEVQNICKKIDRDGITDEHKENLLLEAGDTLFYLTQVLHKQNLNLEDAALECLNKLEKLRRKEGDNGG